MYENAEQTFLQQHLPSVLHGKNCSSQRSFLSNFLVGQSAVCGRRGGLMVGLMVSALDSGASGLGSSPGRGHCVVFLGKTLYSHSASLHPGV